MKQITGIEKTVNTTLSSKAGEALDHYNKATEYLKQGNWAAYGKELQEMKDILTRMSQGKINAVRETKKDKPN